MTGRNFDAPFLRAGELPPDRPLELVVPITVESTDLDYAGIVSNIAYVRWLEHARNRFFARYADPAEWMARHVAAAVAETRIRYLRPVRPGSEVLGLMWVCAARHVGNIPTARAYISDITEPRDRARSFAWLGAAFVDPSLRPFALAAQRVVTANWEAMRPERLPEPLLEAWGALNPLRSESHADS